MLDRAKDKKCNFIIADKPEWTLYLFDVKWQSITSFPGLFGKTKWDIIPRSAIWKDPDRLNKNESISPAWILVLDKIYKNTYLDSYALNIGEDWDKDGSINYEWWTALHPVYLKNPAEKRLTRLASKTPEDNKISHWCINISKTDFDKWIFPYFELGGILATTPDNIDMIDKYIPPYK